MTPRSARIVLVSSDGTLIGSLAPLPIATPWWQDIEPVVSAVRLAYGIEIIVLRLLEAERAMPPGGCVTYLAEVSTAAAATLTATTIPVTARWPRALDEQPLRHSYAHLSGPAADVAWATEALTRCGLALVAAPVQVRTWNLSSLWRLPIGGERNVWLKVVPPFFAHEGRLLALLADAAVPQLLASDGGRSLMAELPGVDLYEASLQQLTTMVRLLVDLQNNQFANLEQLLSIGVPDWRAAPLTAGIFDVLQRTAPELAQEDLRLLHDFVRDLPLRFAQLGQCGVPDTLVHGDFHPGNFRGEGDDISLLDWGDSGVGHPLLDQSAFLDRIPAEHVDVLRQTWFDAWRTKLPSADVARAAQLLAPVAAARQAMIYQRFLDNIETAVPPYHLADPADWLQRTAALLRREAAQRIS